MKDRQTITTTSRKRTKIQTMMYKILHRKLTIEKNNSNLKQGVNSTVSCSSTTSDTSCVNHVTNPVISHAWGKHQIVITTNVKLSSLISKVFGVHNTIHKSKNWGIIMEFVPSKKEYYSRYTTLLKPYKQRTYLYFNKHISSPLFKQFNYAQVSCHD